MCVHAYAHVHTHACALCSLSLPITKIPGFNRWFLPYRLHLILSPLKGPTSKYNMGIKCQHLEPTLTPCQNHSRLCINQRSPEDGEFVCFSVLMYFKKSILKSLAHTVLKIGKCKRCCQGGLAAEAQEKLV